MKKIEIAGSKITPIEFEAFFDYRPYDERAYIFDHVCQQVNDKFYIADLHGVDWKGYKKHTNASCPTSATIMTSRKC